MVLLQRVLLISLEICLHKRSTKSSAFKEMCDIAPPKYCWVQDRAVNH